MTLNRFGRGCLLVLALFALAAAPPERPARQDEPASPDSALPKATDGVLPPGAADKVLAVGGKPLVTLIEPGAQPRADLSYALVQGTSDKMAMTMDMSVVVGTKGQAQPSPATKIPRMSMGMTVATGEKNDAGEFKVDTLLASASVDPSDAQQEDMAKAMRPQLEAMKGISLTYWLTPKGQIHDYKLGIPPTVPAPAQQILKGMNQSFESMVIGLPQEPLGLGGKWRVLSRLASNGADLLQSAVYTLKARDGNLVTLEVKIVQLAAKDTIQNDQMPPGMSAKVKTFRSNASGTTRVDLKSAAPQGGTMTLKTAMDIGVTGAGADSDSSVETTSTIQISRP